MLQAHKDCRRRHEIQQASEVDWKVIIMNITRCRHCNKILALNGTAWTCGPMFCSVECGVAWAKEMYSPEEYMGEIDLHIKATRYFKDIAEEINREDYGARVERRTVYSEESDISTVFEDIYEDDYLISSTIVGWYFGRPNAEYDEEYVGKLTAMFVEE